LQTDEFVVLLVGDVRFTFTDSISSLVPRFACEDQEKSLLPERESAGMGLELEDYVEAGSGLKPEKFTPYSLLFTVPEAAAKHRDSCKPL
jgi:hypothetical protein